MKPSPPRLPEPSAVVAARKSKQRHANLAWLRAQGWEKDAEAFINAWRRGQIRVTFEYSDKAKEVNDETNDSR